MAELNSAGTRFDALKFLSYKTYQAAVGTHTTTLQLDADYDATDNTTAFQGRAVFEPELSGGPAVTNETWQTWNPLTAASGWWQTGNALVGGLNVGKTCMQVEPVLVRPTARRLSRPGDPPDHRPELRTADRRVGCGSRPVAGGSPGFVGNVDSLTVAVDVGGVNGTVTYDFEK